MLFIIRSFIYIICIAYASKINHTVCLGSKTLNNAFTYCLDNMFLPVIFISIVICLIGSYLWTIHNCYNYFKHHGIPGPPHCFFFGHCKDLWSAKSFAIQLQQWTRQHGSIYGIFEGPRPMYIVSDVDFLEEVYIKQFSSFHTRFI